MKEKLTGFNLMRKHLFIEKKFVRIINGFAKYDIITICEMKGFLKITDKIKDVTCKNCLKKISELS